jgi:hypothetical protein
MAVIGGSGGERAYFADTDIAMGMDDKEKLTTLDKFTAPIWGQEIELQQVEYLAGGTPMLRLRIREKKRFTIFDIDAQTAARWGQAMQDWATRQK